MPDSGVPSAVWPPTPYPPDGRYGRAWIAPVGPVVAASSGTWTLTYVAGQYGVDDSGGLRVVFHNNSDFGQPQLSDPQAPNYCTVACSAPAPCYLEAYYSGDLNIRPFKKGLQVYVRDGSLRPGDTIAVTFGDRSGGSPGATAQTFAGPMRFHVLLDAHGTGVYKPVPRAAAPDALPAGGVVAGAPTVQVVAGPPDHLRVHAPSDVVTGQPFHLTVVVRDRWGNAVSHRREAARLGSPGVRALPVQDAASRLRAESNPIRCHAAPPAQRVFWGDLHAQTEETGGTGTLDEYFTYARECAALDFAGHQGNDFIISAWAWERITSKTQAHDAASEFITFAGYEWSGNTPGGGDHNVHFRGGERQSWTLHRSSHWQVLDDAGEAADRFPVTALYDAFRGRDDALLIPHVGGRYANLVEYFDEAVMPLVEIASCWGVFEWFAEDALRRGKVFGFSAGSDDHTSRPGMSFAAPSQFATGGGLTAVLAAERSRDAIWDALRARRTYATTGARILLHLSANGRHPMGAVFDAGTGPVEIAAEVHGTAPLWRVELLRWPEVLYRHPLPPPALPAGHHRLRLGWTGARIRGRRRLTRWDGTFTLEQGRLLDVAGWGFDRPDHGVVERGERAVRWRSETAGDWDGIVVTLEAGDNTPLRFQSGPASFSFTPAQVAAGPLTVEAGGVGQRVVVERDPGPEQPRSAAFTFRDDRPPPGRHPYFVRVTQQDGHVGWSSPIWASITPGA